METDHVEGILSNKLHLICGEGDTTENTSKEDIVCDKEIKSKGSRIKFLPRRLFSGLFHRKNKSETFVQNTHVSPPRNVRCKSIKPALSDLVDDLEGRLGYKYFIQLPSHPRIQGLREKLEREEVPIESLYSSLDIRRDRE